MVERRTMVGVAMLLGACGGATSAGATTPASPITFADALTRAEAAYPDALAFEVEVEEHEGRRVIEVEVLSGDVVEEVFYDPATGEAVHASSETPEADEAAAFPTIRAGIEAGTLSMRRALELASAQHPDGLEAVELQVENGVAVVAVLVRDGAGTTRFTYDPATGAELSHGAGSAEHAE